MIDRRRSEGFVPLGVAGVAGLGLPSVRGRALEIEAAWRRVAGASVARRTRIIGVRRGTLDVEVVDARWRAAVGRLAAELAATLARKHPALGVRNVRVVDAS